MLRFGIVGLVVARALVSCGDSLLIVKRYGCICQCLKKIVCLFFDDGEVVNKRRGGGLYSLERG